MPISNSHPSIHSLLLETAIVTIIIILSIAPLKSSSLSTHPVNPPRFSIEEATIEDLQRAFKENKITSKDVVQFYLNRIKKLNPILRAVIEVNPDALKLAREADKRIQKARIRKSTTSSTGSTLQPLLGIPILVKDNIATKDKMNTTAGSFALLGSVVERDAGVVQRLRQAGAIILGKASLSEWANFRSNNAPSGWSARGGQGQNPYNLSAGPCGSSSGSAIAVAANMVAVSLGTETDGSILCPSDSNSVVGIKPTVGLTSRGTVIPITPRQDTVGPMCRSVADAVYVLDAIVGFDPYDSEATSSATKFIPPGGYTQFLKADGLKGKRLGILPFFDSSKGSLREATFKQHLNTLRQSGAVLVDNLEIANINTIFSSSDEVVAMLAEFKLALNSYLKQLKASPVRSLSDVIKFNNIFAKKEMIKEYGEDVFLSAEATNGMRSKEKKALSKLEKWSREGIEKVMTENELQAIVTLGSDFATVLAIGGYPGISVPAGYDHDGKPFGICFGGLRGTEPILIQIAYAFEQATKIRKRPPL